VFEFDTAGVRLGVHAAVLSYLGALFRLFL